MSSFKVFILYLQTEPGWEIGTESQMLFLSRVLLIYGEVPHRDLVENMLLWCDLSYKAKLPGYCM